MAFVTASSSRICRKSGRLACGALLVAAVFLSGCGHSAGRLPTTVNVEANAVDLKAIVPGKSSKSEVVAIMGEPPFVYEEPWGTEWYFPVRALSNTAARAVPAPLLKVWFNASGRALDYGFFDPRTNAPLAVTETAEETENWYRGMCDPPASILLARAIQRGISTSEDVIKALAPWPADAVMPRWLKKSQVKRTEAGGRKILIFWVDRPSLYYVPPFYAEVFFGDETVRAWGFHGYGGCK